MERREVLRPLNWACDSDGDPLRLKSGEVPGTQASLLAGQDILYREIQFGVWERSGYRRDGDHVIL